MYLASRAQVPRSFSGSGPGRVRACRREELAPALSQPLGTTQWSSPAASPSPRLLSLESSVTHDLLPVSKGNPCFLHLPPIKALSLRGSHFSSEPSLFFPCYCLSLSCQPSHFLPPNASVLSRLGGLGPSTQ